MSHILGYARVSTDDQDLAGQRKRLTSAGAFRVFEDVISGKTFDRPGLTGLLDHIRPGDTIAVVRLDRLGRSLRELLEVVETLKKRGIALLSLEEKIDTWPVRLSGTENRHKDFTSPLTPRGSDRWLRGGR